ncbi:hypothetical protein CEXT_669151 [Caerostris extrusa]|uniref:Uncharacterized protein n=1 Tax=Caerostris extrusa TaxID=172846 RepID=A0AAV4SU54_CAEEX|nr:hypothetical protein CEXT_669151 [Caerostris extrusa]
MSVAVARYHGGPLAASNEIVCGPPNEVGASTLLHLTLGIPGDCKQHNIHFGARIQSIPATIRFTHSNPPENECFEFFNRNVPITGLTFDKKSSTPPLIHPHKAAVLLYVISLCAHRVAVARYLGGSSPWHSMKSSAALLMRQGGVNTPPPASWESY